MDLAYPGRSLVNRVGASGNSEHYRVTASASWQVNPVPNQPFDASGLLWWKGKLLSVNDKGASLYEIKFAPTETWADLARVDGLFEPDSLRPFAGEKVGRYDCEGIAMDRKGRIYICEEANRWVLRCDPATGTTERLAIDWSPVMQYFDDADKNASWEGIAVANDTLYLANERKRGRIVMVDLRSNRVTDSFVVKPAGSMVIDIHYSDLCWFENHLWVLCRESQTILKVAPSSKKVVAEFSFRDLEEAEEVKYRSPFTGTMEGLAVTQSDIWLVTDNNGKGRKKYPEDTRPTLFKCPRPDLKGRGK